MDLSKFTESIWHALCVPSLMEFVVADACEAVGVRAFVPVELRNIRVSRHAKKTREIKLALIPEYVFVQFEGAPDFARVTSLRHVKGYVKFGEVAGEIKHAEMVPFLRAAKIEQFQRSALRVGDMHELLPGLLGQVVEVSESHASVVLPFFGGKRIAKISLDARLAA